MQIRMRGKAARALLRHTKTAMQDLQHDEDEMLRGKHHVGEALIGIGACVVFMSCKTKVLARL